jgi:hypothetical protein
MLGKRLVPWALVFAASPSFAGTMSLTSTPYPDSVVIEVTIDDTGGAAGCPWIAITRRGTDVFYIERQIGTTITRRFVDTNVEASTLYCYEAALRLYPVPVPFPCGGTLCDAFDCFYQIQTCVNTGPDPGFIGHGFLRSEFPDGTPVDGNEVRALLYPCGGTGWSFIGLHTLGAEVQADVDTGTAVDVYGTWQCCWAQGVWLLQAQAAEPHECVVAVEQVPWSRVKSIYRE